MGENTLSRRDTNGTCSIPAVANSKTRNKTAIKAGWNKTPMLASKDSRRSPNISTIKNSKDIAITHEEIQKTLQICPKIEQNASEIREIMTYRLPVR